MNYIDKKVKLIILKQDNKMNKFEMKNKYIILKLFEDNKT